MRLSFILFFSLILFYSCGDNSMQVAETVQGNAPVTFSEGTPGFDQIRPIFQNKCSMCHNGSTHPKNWTDYDTALANLSNINNRVFVIGNMPAIGALSAEEKSLLKAWIEAKGPLVGSGRSATPTTPATTVPIPAPANPVPDTPVPGTPTGVVGFDQARTVFENKCYMCHNGSTHPKNWTIYEVARANLSNIHNRVFVTGDMPAAGSLSAAEKNILKAWIDADGPLISSGSMTTTPPPSTTTPSSPAPTTPLPATALGRGELLVNNKCLSCHGSLAKDLNTPLLHGQQKSYLIKQLNDFKFDRRKDFLMNAMNSMAKSLTDTEISDIATYLSAQSPCSITINVNPLTGSVTGGQRAADRCFNCHTEKAPVLSGQKTAYLKAQLLNFRSLARSNEKMSDEAEDLSNGEINDLAAYFNSRRNCR